MHGEHPRRAGVAEIPIVRRTRCGRMAGRWLRTAVVVAMPLMACSDDRVVPPGPISDSAVEIVATGCPGVIHYGTGLVVAPGLVLTAAHVVAGATSVEATGHGGSGVGELVAFDPDGDLALLRVDRDLAPPRSIGDASQAHSGSLVVFRDHQPVVLPVDIVRSIIIDTTDIYGGARVTRQGYELAVSVEPGDSGAVLIVDGHASAVVWARSQSAESRTWAVEPDAVLDVATDTVVASGRCL
jgi:S1-C subfamily serine protease